MEENLILLLLCTANLVLNTANFVLLLRVRKARRDVSEKLDRVMRSVMNYTAHYLAANQELELQRAKLVAKTPHQEDKNKAQSP